MVHVDVNCRDPRRHREELDQALREFKGKVKKAGILADLKKHEHHISPSKKRRLKTAESIKQRKRVERKQQWQARKEDF